MTNTKNRKINSNKQHRTPLFKRPWMLVLMGILVVIVTVILIVIITKPNTNEETKDSPTTTESEDKNDQSNSQTSTEKDKEEEDRPDDKVVQFEGEDPNDLEELTGVITYSGVENNNLIIDINIDQYLTNGGTCTATIRGQKTGYSVMIDHEAHADVSVSYCEPFTVSIAEFPSDYYDIDIILLSNGKKGTIKDGVQL